MKYLKYLRTKIYFFIKVKIAILTIVFSFKGLRSYLLEALDFIKNNTIIVLTYVIFTLSKRKFCCLFGNVANADDDDIEN